MSVENIPQSRLDTTPSEVRNWTDRDLRTTLAGRRAAESTKGEATKANAGKANTSGNLTESSKPDSAPVESGAPHGDSVSLASAETADVSYAKEARPNQHGGAPPEVDGELVEASVDRQVSLSVEGEMSAEELRDIKKMLASISPIAVYPPGPLVLDGTGFESMAGFEMHTRQALDITEIQIKRKPEPSAATTSPEAPADSTAKPANGPDSQD